MRQLQGTERTLVNLTATGFAIFFVYAIAVTLPFYITRPVYICLCYILVFCLYPASANSPKDRISVPDFILCGLTFLMTVFFFMEYEYYVEKPGLMRTDVPAALERLLPKGIRYAHEEAWHDGNGHSHVRSALLGPSCTFPFGGGKPLLGTWQQIVFLELDTRPRTREVVVQLVGE